MTLNAPILSKLWTITPNVRNTFTTLLDMGAWFAFTNFSGLITNGWSVKYTCDGTTGPTSSSDHTNRLVSRTNFTTQGAAAGNAQSFFVVTNADGVDLAFCYQGASNDIIRISYSPGGLFTPAGTSNQQPTATDEVVLSNGNSIVNATTSSDRVMTMWFANDTRQWSVALFRASAIVNIIGVEKITDFTGSGTFTIPYVGYRLTTGSRGSIGGTSPGAPVGGASGTAPGSAGNVGIMARVVTVGISRITRIGGGEIIVCSSPGNVTGGGQTFVTNPPALQAAVGAPLFPLFWSGEQSTNLDGPIGYPADWFQQLTNNVAVPALGTFLPGYDPTDIPGVSSVRSNWFIALGSSMIRPWRNVDVSLQIA